MKDSTIVVIVAIICITVLEVVNMLTMRIDGNVLSSIIGAIVFIATRAYYKSKQRNSSGEKNA